MWRHTAGVQSSQRIVRSGESLGDSNRFQTDGNRADVRDVIPLSAVDLEAVVGWVDGVEHGSVRAWVKLRAKSTSAQFEANVASGVRLVHAVRNVVRYLALDMVRSSSSRHSSNHVSKVNA